MMTAGMFHAVSPLKFGLVSKFLSNKDRDEVEKAIFRWCASDERYDDSTCLEYGRLLRFDDVNFWFEHPDYSRLLRIRRKDFGNYTPMEVVHIKHDVFELRSGKDAKD